MTNLKLILAFPVMIVISISFVKYLSKTRSLNGNELCFNNNTEEQYDLSLRNFHPNITTLILIILIAGVFFFLLLKFTDIIDKI